MTDTHAARFARIPLLDIELGENVRLDLTNILAMSQSIQRHGLLQPLVVVPTAEGDRVEVLFGHRRFEACRRAGLTVVPCFVRARGDERTRLLTQMAENFDRESMTVLEKALAYQRLVKAGMTQAAIGETVGVGQGVVSRSLMLLDYPELVQRAVHDKVIGLNDALAIPLEIANETDGRTLAAALRRGGRHVREWARHETAREQARGRTVKTKADLMGLMIDGALGERVRSAAREQKETIGEWVGKACRSRLADQDARRVAGTESGDSGGER